MAGYVDAPGGRTRPLRCFAIRVLSSAFWSFRSGILLEIVSWPVTWMRQELMRFVPRKRFRWYKISVLYGVVVGRRRLSDVDCVSVGIGGTENLV